MNEYKSIKQYLKDLEQALKGLDPALIADALDDAEEHLLSTVEEYTTSGRESTQDAIKAAIEEYGSPLDISEEYRKLEPENEKTAAEKENPSLFYQIFGVYLKPRTYLNVAYLLLQFPLGLIYFSYLAVAVLLIVVLVITWIGIPLGILFLFSIFALSWFHGRISEEFLGIRMPRRKRKLITKETTWQKMASILNDLVRLRIFTSSQSWDKMKRVLTDHRLYTSALYLALVFPLGIIYFVGIVALFSAAITLMIFPIMDSLSVPLLVELFEGTWGQLDLVWFNTTTYRFVYPVLGFIMLTGTFHLFNIVANMHGEMTKALLVKR